MASGKNRKSNPSASPNIIVYTTSSLNHGCNSIRFVTEVTLPIAVRLAVADSATADDAEYVEYETEILSHGVLERTGLVLAAAQKLVAYSSAANVSVVVTGIETSTA